MMTEEQIKIEISRLEGLYIWKSPKPQYHYNLQLRICQLKRVLNFKENERVKK